MTLFPVAIFAVATVASALGTEAVRRWALRSNRLVDVPNHRSSHTQPTPRGGGLGIVLALALAAPLVSPAWAPLGLALVCIAGISLVDDLRPLPSRVRFGVHLLAASIVVFGFGVPSAIALPGVTLALPRVVMVPLALIWVAGLINAYNFMDGIDGIAGTQGVIAGLCWALFGYLHGTEDLVVGLTAAGACLGFLTRNWSPAKIFMGDVGSTSLGLLFAAMALGPVQSEASPRPFLALAFVLPFVGDTAFTFLRRLKARERVFDAHRTHIYQLLAPSKAQHRAVSLFYGTLASCGALVLLASAAFPALALGFFCLPIAILAAAARKGLRSL